MRKLSLLILVAGLFLAVPTAARADFAVLYPDGAEAFAIHLAPGVNVVALLNDGADPDIFTMHLDGFSHPALASLIGEIRHQTGTFVDLLKANPEFQKGLDERMRRVRERGGASQ